MLRLKKKNIVILSVISLVLVVVVFLVILFYPLVLKNGNIKVRIGSVEWLVESASNDFSRAKGLSGRERLGENNGMLFVFPKKDTHRFWMRGMKFPLDIIWIKDRRVVGFSTDLPPANFMNMEFYSPPEPVNLVLEVNAGSVEKYGIKKGDEVFIYENGNLVL